VPRPSGTALRCQANTADLAVHEQPGDDAIKVLQGGIGFVPELTPVIGFVALPKARLAATNGVTSVVKSVGTTSTRPELLKSARNSSRSVRAPGYYSVLFEDPDGIRLEMCFVRGAGVLAEKKCSTPLVAMTSHGRQCRHSGGQGSAGHSQCHTTRDMRCNVFGIFTDTQ
jgi:hypothetical protein